MNVDNLILGKTDLNLNMSSALPLGSSTQGATSGALDKASMADLAGNKGFVAGDPDPDSPAFTGDGLQDTDTKPDITASPFNGFLGRPQGWQR